jgi:hypothetical protein
MRKFLIGVLCAGIIGCNTTSVYVRTSAENKSNLAKLSVGMTKDEALKVMGTSPQKGGYIDSYGVINNPCKSETIQGKNGPYDAVYYFTDPQETRDQWEKSEITYDEMTALLFQDGKLAGWGKKFLKENVPEYELLRFHYLFDK